MQHNDYQDNVFPEEDEPFPEEQEYIPDPSITEEGPWHVYYDKGEVKGIGSHDFTHDVMFGLSGDFYDYKQREQYANEIVSRLNAYGNVVKPDNQVETFEALRHLVDVMDNMDEGQPIPEPLKEALANARWALMGRAAGRRRAQLNKIQETLDTIAKKLGVSNLNEEHLRAHGVSDQATIEDILAALTRSD